MSSTQTLTFERKRTPTDMSATTAAPENSTKLGFFKRRLGNHRKRNTIDFSTQPADAHPAPVPADETNHIAPPIPQIEVRRPSFTPSFASSRKPSIATQDSLCTDVLSPATTLSSKTGVRFAPSLFDAEDDNDERPSRGRYLGDTSPRIRRSSIYARSREGVYDDGVDAGVGSKARRLSVQIPDSFEVDECKLEEHFGPVARMRKKQIGEGGAATVQIMVSKTAGGETTKDRVYAVKEFRAWEADDEPRSEYERKIKSEYAIAKACEHPNIVQSFHLCYSHNRNTWHHVMEYCEVGDLNDAINRAYFSRDDRTCMFKQLLRGVDYLHSRGIAHRDLKSENLLITSTGCLKIADFGTSEVFSGTHPGLRNCRRPSLIGEDPEVRHCNPGLVGSRPYMAPELIRRQHPYDPRAVDMWSTGVILLTLIIGGTPWPEASTDIKNFNIYCASWDEWLDGRADGVLDPDKRLPKFGSSKEFALLGDQGTKCLAFGLLHPDPEKRWSAQQALEFPTVVDYPCCQQNGYSDDIRTRQRKALHNHVPPKKTNKVLGGKGAGR